MNRRDLLSHLPMGLLLLGPGKVLAATECIDWEDVPGTEGRIKMRSLWKSDTGPGSCVILQIADGVWIPRHLHPEGEFTHIIEGSFSIGGGCEREDYFRGDTFYMPPGSIHDPQISHGVTVLTMTPTPVQYV